jgi:hypothetical protein
VKTLTRRPTQFGRGNETIDARWLSSAKIRLIFLRSAEGEHLYTAVAGRRSIHSGRAPTPAPAPRSQKPASVNA